MTVTPPVAEPPGDDSPGPRLVVGVVDDPGAAAALADEWEALADRCGAGPLVRPTYALAWWEHLGRGRLLVVTVREGTRLVALAPLHERPVGPLRVVRWLGHGLGTVAQVLLDPGCDAAAELLWDELSTPRRVWELVECRDGAAGLPPARRGRGLRRTTTVGPRDVCPVADLGGGLDELLQGSKKKNLRRTLNKCDRLLQESGSVYRTDVATDLAAFEAQLADLRAVVDAAEAERPKLHLLRPPYGTFVLDTLRALLERGDAVSLVGYVDDAPATVHVWLRQARTLSLWIARFDPRFAAFSPGHLSYRAAYSWAEDSGVTRMDLLLGESQAKRFWATDSYGTLDVVSGHPSAVALARGAERLASLVRGVRR